MIMITLAKRQYLKHLVAGKNEAFRPLTGEEKALGFLGWHERGYLPHCDYPDLVQFVTFRLEDSMPAAGKREWEHLLEIEDVREKRTQLEGYLDRGIGQCHLRDANIAALVEQALLHRHGEGHEILAWVVMPNHVHVLVDVRRSPLWKLILSWKRYVATRALAHLRAGSESGAPGAAERRTPMRRAATQANGPPNQSSSLHSFWQREYWDTYMRDAEQERKSIRYIEGNPARAKLVLDPATWRFSSARFRDAKTWELQLPRPRAPHSDAAR